MAKQEVIIELELDDNIKNIIKMFADYNGLTLSEAYSKLINNGIASGAKNIEEALTRGISMQKEFLEELKEYKRLSEIVKGPIPTALETEKKVTPNVEKLRDEALIQKITDEYNSKM